MKEYDSDYPCHWRHYNELIQTFKEAVNSRTFTLIAKLKRQIEDFAKKCGATPSLFECVENIEKSLTEKDQAYVKNCIPFIQRSLDSEDVETANLVLCDVNRVVGCKCKDGKCGTTVIRTMRGFEVLQVNPDGTLSFLEPEDETEKPAPQVERNLALLPATIRNIDVKRTITPPPVYPTECSENCAHKFCPYNRAENYGSSCFHNQEQYKNQTRIRGGESS